MLKTISVKTIISSAKVLLIQPSGADRNFSFRSQT